MATSSPSCQKQKGKSFDLDEFLDLHKKFHFDLSRFESYYKGIEIFQKGNDNELKDTQIPRDSQRDISQLRERLLILSKKLNLFTKIPNLCLLSEKQIDICIFLHLPEVEIMVRNLNRLNEQNENLIDYRWFYYEGAAKFCYSTTPDDEKVTFPPSYSLLWKCPHLPMRDKTTTSFSVFSKFVESADTESEFFIRAKALLNDYIEQAPIHPDRHYLDNLAAVIGSSSNMGQLKRELCSIPVENLSGSLARRIVYIFQRAPDIYNLEAIKKHDLAEVSTVSLSTSFNPGK